MLSIMPDVAHHAGVELAGALDWVGMSDIEVPVTWTDNEGRQWRAPARAEAYVSLDDPQAKGIHMSRLFLHTTQSLNEPLTPEIVVRATEKFLESHRGISGASFLSIRFDYMVERPALKSGHLGWRAYPTQIKVVNRAGDVRLEVGLKVAYSSTCPCSAALARQLIQDQFRKTFTGAQVSQAEVLEWLGDEQGIMATPHGQRSEADVRVLLNPESKSFLLTELINDLEQALQTPVQAAVKREDEQEFARLNAANLMFCEDAARRIFHALNHNRLIQDFWARATHFESLHPHNAVSTVTKGIPGGYTA